uniref:Serine protease inhibitor serpin 1c n=1 Tax=Mamestra configurata TaxID=174822 RepID=Q8IS84_9NEOP|nr:serine protease inhibitor serpin 1c [Mamestra configurata]
MKLFICILALAATAMSEESNVDLLKSSNEVFTANMFQEVVKAKPGENVVLSAFSVLSPLAQLSLASVGESHDEILKAIGLPNDNVTKEVFTDVSKQLRSVKGVELRLANKVYVRQGAVLNDEFAAVSKDVFNSDVKNVDFTKNVEAAKEINEWVEENTNHKIKDLVSSESLDASTAAVLVNAIYFKGKWKKPFDESATRDLDFFVTKDQPIKKPTMHKSGDFKYAESKELDAKLLELPYEGDQSSLLIVLPNEIDGIGSLVEKLKDPTALSKAVENMFYNEVIVDLPKFKIETTTDLKAVLKKMNIVKLFTGGEARLNNLIKGESDLFITDAIQKAFIDVNEEGAEAAVANAFYISRMDKSIPTGTPFTVDRPFFYALKTTTGTLFSGVLYS